MACSGGGGALATPSAPGSAGGRCSTSEMTTLIVSSSACRRVGPRLRDRPASGDRPSAQVEAGVGRGHGRRGQQTIHVEVGGRKPRAGGGAEPRERPGAGAHAG